MLGDEEKVEIGESKNRLGTIIQGTMKPTGRRQNRRSGTVAQLLRRDCEEGHSDCAIESRKERRRQERQREKVESTVGSFLETQIPDTVVMRGTGRHDKDRRS